MSVTFLLRICSEFQAIFDRASRTPESSEELVELIDFIDSARNVELVQLTESVKVSLVVVHIANLTFVIDLFT